MIRKMILIAAAALAMGSAAPASAQFQGGFCEGFRDGWKAAFENRNMPESPIPPCSPAGPGQDTYKNGFERGMIAAISIIGRRPY
jgi:hypothetical protein